MTELVLFHRELLSQVDFPHCSKRGPVKYKTVVNL